MNQLLVWMVALAVAGALTHQLKQLLQSRRDGEDGFDVFSYWTNNWVQTLLSIIGSAVVLSLTYVTYDEYAVTLERLLFAYTVGISGNTLAEAYGSRERVPTSTE